MARRRLHDEDVALIEMTPMIDVVFLLLIFFMVSTKVFDPYGYDVELPETKDAPQQQGASESLVVAVDEDGRAALNGRFFEPGERLPDLGQQVDIVIRADRNATHGQVMYWMDKLQSSGVKAVTLASVPFKD